LGAVWIGVYPRDERVVVLRELLSLPARDGDSAMRYRHRPAEHPAPVGRFRLDRIREEQW